MRRRNLMTILAGAAAYTLLAGAAFVRPIAADAQPAAGIPRIGVLMVASPSDEAPKLEAFRGALEKLGYADGQTILIELRYAMGEPDRFGSLARELVALAPFGSQQARWGGLGLREFSAFTRPTGRRRPFRASSVPRQAAASTTDPLLPTSRGCPWPMWPRSLTARIPRFCRSRSRRHSR